VYDVSIGTVKVKAEIGLYLGIPNIQIRNTPCPSLGDDLLDKFMLSQVLVSEVTDEGKVYACAAKDGPALEKLMDALREEFTANPPVSHFSSHIMSLKGSDH